MKKRLVLILGLGALLTLACYTSALAVPTQTPSAISSPSESTPPHEETGLYKVTSEVLEVRLGPDESEKNVGYLKRGESVKVYYIRKVKLEMCLSWAYIGGGRWVCADHLEEAK